MSHVHHAKPRRPLRRLRLIQATREARRVRVARRLGATLLVASATVATADPSTLAAGPRGSLGWQVAVGERARALAVEAVETQGSRQSLALVDEGAADFAIVQEDLFRNHLAARRRAGTPSRARAVERLYFRYLSLLVRRPLYVESVRELPRLRVWIGEPDGDNRAAVYELLERVGLPAPDTTATPCPAGSPDEGLIALRRCFEEGMLDVALVLTAPGEPVITRLAADGVAAPASLDYRALRLLVDSYDAQRPYRFASLGEVQTVAVPVLLVAGRDVSASRVEAVARALEEETRDLLAAGVSLQRLRESGLGTDELYEDIYLSLGDPTGERALLNANAQDAAGIVVLADERAGEHADEQTLRSLFMLRRLARERGCHRLHVVAEILDGRNQAVCDEMARDFPGLLETVSGGEVRACLLAQAALEPGIVGFYRDLFSVSEATNEVYSLALPPEAVGMSFGAYCALVMERRDERAPVLPVGICRNRDGRAIVLCNPHPVEAAATIEEGDRLVVLAYGPPPEDVLPRPGRGDRSSGTVGASARARSGEGFASGPPA